MKKKTYDGHINMYTKITWIYMLKLITFYSFSQNDFLGILIFVEDTYNNPRGICVKIKQMNIFIWSQFMIEKVICFIENHKFLSNVKRYRVILGMYFCMTGM